MSPGKPYDSRPCDMVRVRSALDGLTYYVRRRDLLAGETQCLPTFQACGEPNTWGPAGLPREHIIFEDHDDATILLQQIYVALDGWYDAAAGNAENGDAGCFVPIEKIRELYGRTVVQLANAGS